MEGNVSKAAGTCGIEMYYADHVVVQNNEVYETRVKAGGADSKEKSARMQRCFAEQLQTEAFRP